jgi:hypothetical protein
VAIALVATHDTWPARLVTAIAWPVGPLAFLVVVAILLFAAAILWPVVMLGLAAAIGGLIWLL